MLCERVLNSIAVAYLLYNVRIVKAASDFPCGNFAPIMAAGEVMLNKLTYKMKQLRS